MKQKLDSFEKFVSQLLPHETDFLLSESQIIDPERLSILITIAQATHSIDELITLDPTIDRRKYSHLKNWIADKLEKIDVDQFYSWINTIDLKIMQDSIDPAEERQLLKYIKSYQHCHFYFTKFYEVLQNYSHFLLVRLRLKDYNLVSAFLNTYDYSYKYNKLLDDNLHKTSSHIIDIYTQGEKITPLGREWLTDVLYSEQAQGYLRYLALIRLHFCSLCDGQYDHLSEHYEFIGSFFSKGEFYSKRILVNYYFNKMLLHNKFEEYKMANYYGYLSIKVKTHDFLLYSNNLSATLIKQQKYTDALQVLKKANPDYKNSNNFWHKTDYVTFFMECLIGNKELKAAENYGLTFFKAYKKEILESRWYTFFSTLLKALYLQKKYGLLKKLILTEKLLFKEQNLPGSALKVSFIEHYFKESENISRQN